MPFGWAAHCALVNIDSTHAWHIIIFFYELSRCRVISVSKNCGHRYVNRR